MKSNKNQVKWAVSEPFKLTVFRSVPKNIKYIALVLIPLLVGILVKLRSFLKGRAL
jgi:hypothetical protein